MVLGPSPSPSPSPRSPSSSSSPPSSCCSSSCSSSSVTVVLPSRRPSSFLHSATISPPPSSSSSPSCSSSSPYSPAVTTSSLSCHGRASLQKTHSRRHHLHHPILNSFSSSSSFSRRSNTVFLPWSSFIFSSRSFSFIVHCRGLGKKPRAPYSFLSVRADLGGQYDDNFADVDKHLLDYFTYKAVRTVLVQLYEMNPTEYAWFYKFVVDHKPQDSKLFLRTLVQEKQELCERVMVTRLHLYNKWIKKHDHSKMYQAISDQNLELLRERLVQTIKWADSENTDKI